MWRKCSSNKIYFLSTEELVHLLTNNIPAEQHLADFAQRAPVANFINKKLKAKAIRNDMVLYRSIPFSNLVEAKKFHVVVKLLNDMELLRTDDQDLQKAKILEKMA